MPKIHVKKTFVFSRLPLGAIISVEKRYDPGVHDIDDAMAAHPWIKDDLADGCIESPQVIKARLKEERERAEKEEAEAAVFLAQAEAAVQRSTRVATIHGNSVSPEEAAKQEAEAKAELQRNLNTPVSQLRAVNAGGRRK